MTLASRLLLATLLLVVGTTFAFAWLTKQSWERAESARFEAEFRRAISDLERDLTQARTLGERRLEPLCAHGTLVDSALAGLESSTLDSRLLSIKLALEEERRALEVGELALIDDRSNLLAGSFRGRSTRTKPGGERPLPVGTASGQIRTQPDLAFEVGCKRASGGRSVLLVASIPIEPLLADAGARHSLRLVLVPSTQGQPLRAKTDLWETVRLAGLEGRVIEASRSRSDLMRLLGEVDLALLTVTLVVLGGAAFVALFVARAVSRPISSFAERTRDVLRGNAEPLPVTGGRELEQAARAFNQTLADLAELRAKLALTERIVARREVARQVAHEVNNPLMPIRTSIETLRKLRHKDQAKFDAYFDEASGIVLHEVNRLARLVESFAAYARLPDPKLEHFDLADLCEKLVTLFSSAAEARGVEVGFAASGPLDVYADRDQLSQALTNLIKNAIEAAPHSAGGSVQGHVWVSVSDCAPERPGLYAILVEDDGPGVPASVVPRLFTPYETTKAGGTGLGLAIAERIAIEHGGGLTYASSPRGGAAFTLTLKAAPEASLPDRPHGAGFP